MKRQFNSASIVFGSLIVAHALPAYAVEEPPASANLQIMWSTPVVAFPGPPAEVGQTEAPTLYKGFFLYDASMLPNGHIDLLGMMMNLKDQRLVLIKNIDQPSPETINLPTKETPPDLSQEPSWFDKLIGLGGNQPSNIPGINTFCSDGSGNIWLGGDTHEYMGIASENHSDDYLEKLDSSYQPLWARSDKFGIDISVIKLTPTPTGNLGVLTEAFEAGFASLSLVSQDSGDVSWSYKFGNGRGVSITRANLDGFLIAAFFDQGSGATYQQNVSVLSISDSGHLQYQTVVRPDINEIRGSYYGDVHVASSGSSAYILSSWNTNMQPSEITKVSGEGKILWTKVIPNSVEPWAPNPKETEYCNGSAISTLSNGDAFVACSLGKKIYFYEFDQSNGNDFEQTAPIPPCDEETRGQSLFLFPQKDGSVSVVGSGGLLSGSGCTWLGRLVPHL